MKKKKKNKCLYTKNNGAEKISFKAAVNTRNKLSKWINAR